MSRCRQCTTEAWASYLVIPRPPAVVFWVFWTPHLSPKKIHYFNQEPYYREAEPCTCFSLLKYIWFSLDLTLFNTSLMVVAGNSAGLEFWWVLLRAWVARFCRMSVHARVVSTMHHQVWCTSDSASLTNQIIHIQAIARPKRQGAVPCRFVRRPVVFPQRPVVFFSALSFSESPLVSLSFHQHYFELEVAESVQLRRKVVRFSCIMLLFASDIAAILDFGFSRPARTLI